MKITIKSLKKGLAYWGLVASVIFLMMAASSCSAQPKPEMTEEEAANLTQSIRDEIGNAESYNIDYTISMEEIQYMESAEALDNYLSDKIGSYVFLSGVDDFIASTGLEGYGITSVYSNGDEFDIGIDIAFIDIENGGYSGVYGYLAKEKNVEYSYMLVGCFPTDSNGFIDPNFFGYLEDTNPPANSSDALTEETTAVVDPELTDPSTHPSDLSKCFTIDMFAQAKRTTMSILNEHVGEWVHLVNLNASIEDGTSYLYAYVGSENSDMDGNGTLPVIGEGGYMSIALADGLTDEFYGFVGIDGMTQEIYIGNLFTDGEVISDPSGENWDDMGSGVSDPTGSLPLLYDSDVSANEIRFLGMYEGQRIQLEAGVMSIDRDCITTGESFSKIYFTDPADIWLVNENDTILVECTVVNEYDNVVFTDAVYITTTD